MKKLFILLLYIYVSDAFLLPLTENPLNKLKLKNTANIKKNSILHQPKRKIRQTLLIFIHSKAMFQIIC